MRVERHIGVDALALDIMGEADDGGFGNAFMQDQRAFNLCGAHAVARHVDDVVHPASDPVIAVRIPPRAIAGRIFAGEGGEIGLEEAIMIAPHGAHLTRPALRDDEIAFGRALQHMAFRIDNLRHHAGHRQGGGAGLQVGGAGRRRNHRRTCFRLPPCVDDRAAPFADNAVIPAPGFRVDRLAHGAQQPE